MLNTNRHINSQGVQINPVKLSERFHSLDILRGIAILGILVINIEFFAQPFAKLINPLLSNNFTGLNYYLLNICCLLRHHLNSMLLLIFVPFLYQIL